MAKRMAIREAAEPRSNNRRWYMLGTDRRMVVVIAVLYKKRGWDGK
jgi:hypothetical protein